MSTATSGRAEVPVISLEKNKSQHVGPQLSESLRESTSACSPDGRGLRWGSLTGAGDVPTVRAVPLAFQWLCPVPALPWAQHTPLGACTLVTGYWYPLHCPGQTRMADHQAQPRQVWEEGRSRQAGQVPKEGAWKRARLEERRAGSRGQGHVLRLGLEGGCGGEAWNETLSNKHCRVVPAGGQGLRAMGMCSQRAAWGCLVGRSLPPGRVEGGESGEVGEGWELVGCLEGSRLGASACWSMPNAMPPNFATQPAWKRDRGLSHAKQTLSQPLTCGTCTWSPASQLSDPPSPRRALPLFHTVVRPGSESPKLSLGTLSMTFKGQTCAAVCPVLNCHLAKSSRSPSLATGLGAGSGFHHRSGRVSFPADRGRDGCPSPTLTIDRPATLHIREYRGQMIPRCGEEDLRGTHTPQTVCPPGASER